MYVYLQANDKSENGSFKRIPFVNELMKVKTENIKMHKRKTVWRAVRISNRCEN